MRLDARVLGGSTDGDPGLGFRCDWWQYPGAR
jgi:hypothetical protein